MTHHNWCMYKRYSIIIGHFYQFNMTTMRTGEICLIMNFKIFHHYIIAINPHKRVGKTKSERKLRNALTILLTSTKTVSNCDSSRIIIPLRFASGAVAFAEHPEENHSGWEMQTFFCLICNRKERNFGLKRTTYFYL